MLVSRIDWFVLVLIKELDFNIIQNCTSKPLIILIPFGNGPKRLKQFIGADMTIEEVLRHQCGLLDLANHQRLSTAPIQGVFFNLFHRVHLNIPANAWLRAQTAIEFNVSGIGYLPLAETPDIVEASQEQCHHQVLVCVHVEWLGSVSVRLEHAEVGWVQGLDVVEFCALLCQLSRIVCVHVLTLVLEIELVLSRFEKEVFNAL